MKLDHFEQLRRAAFERGMADYERTMRNPGIGDPVFKTNPFANNHATDEAQYWEQGWQNAKESDDENQE